MSDTRKILVAKRHNDRNNAHNRGNNHPNRPENNAFQKGIKRTLPPATPKKNLANDRLKRLRTELSEQAKNSPSVSSFRPPANTKLEKQKSFKGNYKRRPNINEDVHKTKVPKNAINTSLSRQNNSRVEVKTSVKEQTNRNIFTLAEPNTSFVSNQLETIFRFSGQNEDMEWSPSEETGLTTEPQTSKVSDPNNRNDFFIVVDTNVFISQLHLLKQILDLKTAERREPIIFIPWIVIEELDFIKEDSAKSNLKWKAQEAVKFIEKNLSIGNPRMIGQTLNEVNEQKHVGKSQDNKIIGCCLQILEKPKNMILLTNDINLKNKAHINKVPVCAQNEIMNKILMVSKNAQLIFDKMTSLCNIVIEECAQKAYGIAYNKMPICQSKPQSLPDCIAVFIKYWFPVFQEFLMKQFKKAIEDLSQFLLTNKNIKDGSGEINELVRHSVRICVFLKDVESCKSIIENTIRELNDIKSL